MKEEKKKEEAFDLIMLLNINFRHVFIAKKEKESKKKKHGGSEIAVLSSLPLCGK